LTGDVSDQFVEGVLTSVILVSAVFELAFPRKEGSAPGDLGFDPLKLQDFSPPGFQGVISPQRRWTAEAELKHGRLAMIAFTYDVVDELLTGIPVVEDTEYTFHMLDARVFNKAYWTFQPDVLDGLADATDALVS